MKVLSWVKTVGIPFAIRHWQWLIYALLITGIFLVNSLHESYPDEFDNILGGHYILAGRLPYVGFFTHHGPVAYFVAALVEIFSGQSFVRFRIVYAIFLLALTFGGYWFLRRRFGGKVAFYPILIFTIGITATYFWAHMLLADSLSGFLLLPPFLLLLLSTIYKRTLSLGDLAFITLGTFTSLFSSLTYLYLIVILYAFTLFSYIRTRKDFNPKKDLKKPLIVLALPFIAFALYLVVTRGVGAYIQQNIIFNERYYIYNYPRPEGSGYINPVRFAILIAAEYYGATTGLLINAKDFNLTYPFNSALAIADIGLIIVVLLGRRYSLAAFLLLVYIYANGRSNPLTSKETDYQSAVYIMFSLGTVGFLLPYLYKLLNEPLELAKKILYGFLFLVLGLYAFFSFLFLFRRFEEKVIDKYMGRAPLIYDRPQLAPIMNKLVSDNDYMWIGPFEFEELFYAKGKLPSKFHILIPGIGKSSQVQEAMIADFTKHKPKVIMFDRAFFILGSSPETFGQFFLKFLADNYVTLYDYRPNGIRYVSIQPITPRIDLETKLYIDKDRFNEVLDRLLQEHLVKPQ